MTTLTTARLILRPFMPSDAPAYALIRLHPKVMPWLPPPPDGEKPLATAQRMIDHFAQCWAEHGVGPWAVCDRQSGALLGHCGLRYLPDFDGVEALWTLHPDTWGRGLASEAAAASLDFGFGPAGLAHILAITLPDNRASRGVMEKLGMGYRRSLEWKGFTVVYYDIDRAAWHSRRQP